MCNSEPLETVSDLVDIAGRLTSTTVVVAGGERIEDLRLVEAAQDHGIIDRIILVGNKQKIAASIEATGISVDPKDIVHTDDDDHTAAATIDLIHKNVVDIVLKGNISTPIINRHMLPMAMRTTVSLASIFDAAPIAGGRPMILTDAGVTTVCNFGRLTDLISNAVDVAQVVMGIERPRVAILSANEKQIPSLASTWLGLELAERPWDNAVVCGPLSFDLATDPASVEIKGMPKLPNAAEVAGKADILVCPGIDSANILYKAIASMAKYGEASIAGITVGFPVPYIILSRSDPMETRLQSIALCSIYAARKGERKLPAPKYAPVPSEGENILTLSVHETSVKGAVYSNEQCTLEFEAAGGPGSQPGKTAALLTEITGELERNGVSRLKAAAAAARAEQDTAKIELNRLYPVPGAQAKAEFQGLPDSADRLPVITLLSGLSDKYSVPAFVMFAEPVPFTGPHAESLMCAARSAAALSGKPLESLKYVVAHLDEESVVAAVEMGRFSYHAEYRVEDYTSETPGDESYADGKNAFLLAVAREIGGAFVHASCDVEAIILTGPVLKNKEARLSLRRMVGRLAPVIIQDKDTELSALSSKVLSILGVNK